MNRQECPQQELVSTRFFIPPLSETILPRPQIIQRLNEAVASKLSLLSAPAGYGKTTLLCQWAAQTTLPVAWLSLEEADNEPVRFWTSVIAACQTALIGMESLSLIQSQPSPYSSVEAMLTTFINKLALVSQPLVLVLDNCQSITEPMIYHALCWLLDRQPPSLRLVLLSRTEPPLALAGRRVRGELAEIRTGELRFTLAEVTDWFTRLLSLPLSATHLAVLQTRTEGWAAALHLAALSLQNSCNIAETLASFTGSHRYVMDYLVDEVLAHLPEEVSSFLLCTAFLDRFTGPLCDTLTGHSNGQAMLEALERANLFLVSLDEQRSWYRYHQLFAEVLRLRAHHALPDEQRTTLARRASAWHEQHGSLLEAVEMALIADDYETTVRLGITLVPSLLLSGQYTTVARWLQQLPRPLLRSHPWVCLAFTWTLLLSGKRKAAEIPLHETEQLFVADEGLTRSGEVATLRALFARLARDGEQAVQWGLEALALLPEEAVVLRGISAAALGCGYRLQGEVTLARQTLTEASLLNEQADNQVGTQGCTALMGEVLALQGHLTQAANCYQKVLATKNTWLPPTIDAHIALGLILLEQNDLASALTHSRQALELSQQQGDIQFIARSALLQARLLQAYREYEQGEEAFLRALTLARQSKSPTLLAQATAYQARWWLLRNNREALRGFQTVGNAIDAEYATYAQEELALTQARVLLAEGKKEQARRMVDRWHTLANTQGRIGSQIELLMLEARVADALGQIPEALLLLHQALLLAEAERYCRIFVEEGPSMSRLLHLLQSRWRDKTSTAYLERLFRALPGTSAESAAPRSQVPLLSPLSPREYKVLHLLAAGLSTREVADELVVSLNTIKTQVQSLYRKLNVRSRQEALVAARTWYLL